MGLEHKTVFISHSDEDKELAIELFYKLNAAGFKSVFCSEKSLTAAKGYDLDIEKAAKECDIFIFLISEKSFNLGRYTVTELGYAEERWNNPANHVLPVLVPNVDEDTKLRFIKSFPYIGQNVTVMLTKGNFSTDVFNKVKKMVAAQDEKEEPEPIPKHLPWFFLILLIIAILTAVIIFYEYYIAVQRKKIVSGFVYIGEKPLTNGKLAILIKNGDSPNWIVPSQKGKYKFEVPRDLKFYKISVRVPGCNEKSSRQIQYKSAVPQDIYLDSLECQYQGSILIERDRIENGDLSICEGDQCATIAWKARIDKGLFSLKTKVPLLSEKIIVQSNLCQTKIPRSVSFSGLEPLDIILMNNDLYCIIEVDLKNAKYEGNIKVYRIVNGKEYYVETVSFDKTAKLIKININYSDDKYRLVIPNGKCPPLKKDFIPSEQTETISFPSIPYCTHLNSCPKSGTGKECENIDGLRQHAKEFINNRSKNSEKISEIDARALSFGIDRHGKVCWVQPKGYTKELRDAHFKETECVVEK